MSELIRVIGQRIRNYRKHLGLSQEQLAELADFHPTYVGQIERGERNATVESIEKIAKAMNIPLSELFINIEETNAEKRNIPLESYDFLLSKSEKQQEQLLEIMKSVDNYNKNN